MMKTTMTMTFVLLFWVLSTCLFSQEPPKQYLPIFGETSTEYYSVNAGPDYLYYDLLTVTSFLHEGKTLYEIDRTGHLQKNPIEVSPDNSKMWGWASYPDAFLLMDLNLKVGDQFTTPYMGDLTVREVFVEEGRKHVRFDKMFIGVSLHEMWVDSIYFEFIEGIGPNTLASALLPRGLAYSITWLRSAKKDGVTVYRNPLFAPYWEFVGNTAQANSVERVPFKLSPSPAVDVLHVDLGTDWERYDAVTIVNLQGVLFVETKVTASMIPIHIQSLASGKYLVQVTDNQGEKFTVSFLK